MSYQVGRNRGVTGLVDLPGFAAKFIAAVYKYSNALTNQEIDRSGRGTGRWTKKRPLRPGGTLALKGKVRLDGFPLPTDWRGQEGSIVLTQHTSVTCTVSVRVTSMIITQDEKEQDQWDIAFTCTILANPALAGFTGTQPAATSPSPDTVETYEGLSKTHDPDDLQTTAMQRFDVAWFGMADTDAGEGQLIADVIAAAATPLPNLKKRSATLVRTDLDGAVVTVSWGKTTSAEDAINAATSTRIDPSGLTSTATAAGINIAGAVPTGDTFVETGTTTRELNDQNSLIVKEYGLRTAQQAIEEDSSVKEDDPQDLGDSGAIAVITTNATPPAIPTAPVTGSKHRNTITRQLNPTHWLHLFQYGRRNTSDDLIMEATVNEFDPNTIESTATVAVIYANTDTPATPAAPIAGVKHVRTIARALHDTRLLYIYRYAPRDSKDDIEMGGTSTSDDQQNLADYAQITRQNASSTPPATPSAPVGTKLVRVVTEQIHGVVPEVWKHTFHYARRDTMDDLLMELARYTTDTNALNNSATIARFASSEVQPATPTAPTDTKLIDVSHHQIHDAAWVYVFRYGARDSKDDVQMPGTKNHEDPQALEQSAELTLLESSAVPTPPAAPVAGTKYKGFDSTPLKDGKFRNVYYYSSRNTLDDEQMATETVTDANGLDGQKTQFVINESATAPATPTAPTGLKLRLTRSRQLNDGKWRWTFIYAATSTKDDVEMGGTFSAADASALNDHGEISQVTTSATPPSTPAVPAILPGAKFIENDIKQLNDGTWRHTFRYGPRTSEEEITLPGTRYETDPNGLQSREWNTQVTASATRPLIPTPTLSDVKYIGGSTRLLKTGKWVHVFEFAVLDSADQHTTPRQTGTGLVSGGVSNTVASIVNGPSAYLQALSEWAARKGDVTFERVETQRLSDGKILQVVHVTDAFQIVTFRSTQGLGKKLTWARIIGGVAKVFLAQKVQATTSKWWYLLSPQWVPVSDMWFSLRRKVSGSTLPMNWNLNGKINSGAFLGLPEKTVIYVGAGGASNIAIEAPRVSDMAWEFFHESNGFVDETEIPSGWVPTTTDLSSLTAGTWVLASALGLGAAELPTADYSAFLA